MSGKILTVRHRPSKRVVYISDMAYGNCVIRNYPRIEELTREGKRFEPQPKFLLFCDLENVEEMILRNNYLLMVHRAKTYPTKESRHEAGNEAAAIASHYYLTYNRDIQEDINKYEKENENAKSKSIFKE